MTRARTPCRRSRLLVLLPVALVVACGGEAKPQPAAPAGDAFVPAPAPPDPHPRPEEALVADVRGNHGGTITLAVPDLKRTEPVLTQALVDSGCTAIAFETVQAPDGSLPLLVPMSQVAGRMSIQVGADVLLRHHGGRGVLLSGIPGVRPAKVVVLGAGIVGSNAAQIAVGLGADVAVMDVNARVLARLDEVYQGRLKTIVSNPHAVAEEVRDADPAALRQCEEVHRATPR